MDKRFFWVLLILGLVGNLSPDIPTVIEWYHEDPEKFTVAFVLYTIILILICAVVFEP